ncbi:hypothetical protein AB0K55_39505 [Streptomyces massasporeus]
MFHGSIPAPLRSIIYEHAGTWPGEDIYVGCSGNFTIEQVLHARFGDSRRIHGSDIQAYSCALGWYLVGDDLNYTLREEYEESLGWLKPYLEDRIDLLATLMLGTRFLQYVGRDGAYCQRMMDATRDQWERMHDKTATKLWNLQTRLGSFYARDVRDYLDQEVPDDAPVVMFPPFYAKDYQAQFASIDAAFHWPEPAFDELTEDGKERIIEQVQDRPNWVLGLHIERPELRHAEDRPRRGTRRQHDAAHSHRRAVRRDPLPVHVEDHQTGIAADRVRRRRRREADRRFRLPAAEVRPEHRLPHVGLPGVMDRYRRLAKLIVMAASKKEAQLFIQRSLSKRIDGWATTAFTDRAQLREVRAGHPRREPPEAYRGHHPRTPATGIHRASARMSPRSRTS